MPPTLKVAVAKYLRCRKPGTRNPGRVPHDSAEVETMGWWSPDREPRAQGDLRLSRLGLRARGHSGGNRSRAANKAREHLCAVISWAWEQDLIDAPPRFPKPRQQRDVAGRHYLTKSEINAIYFATHKMERPRGWCEPMPIGRYWRSALIVFFHYGVDTGTVWKSARFHEPILWRHVSWDRQLPDREIKEQSPWGWLFYRRVKTGKTFYRPMNRVVHAHIKSIMPENPAPDDPVFLGGRWPNLDPGLSILREFTEDDVETGEAGPWN